MAGLWTEERKKDKKNRKDAKAQDKQREGVVHNLMSTIAGRAFVHGILDGCHAFASSFSLNALQMAFSEGERNVGLKLLTDIMRVCPNYYVLMMKEQNERSASSTDDSDRERTSTSGEHPGGEDAGRGVEGGDGAADPDAPDPHGYYIGHYRP